MSWTTGNLRGSIEEITAKIKEMEDPSIAFYGDSIDQDNAKAAHANLFARAKKAMLAEIAQESKQDGSTGFVTVNFSGHGGIGTSQYSVMVIRHTPEPIEPSDMSIVDAYTNNGLVSPPEKIVKSFEDAVPTETIDDSDSLTDEELENKSSIATVGNQEIEQEEI